MDANVKRFNDGLLELDRMSLSLENLVIVVRDSHDERIHRSDRIHCRPDQTGGTADPGRDRTGCRRSIESHLNHYRGC